MIATVVIVFALANRQFNSKARFVAQGTLPRLKGQAWEIHDEEE